MFFIRVEEVSLQSLNETLKPGLEAEQVMGANGEKG